MFLSLSYTHNKYSANTSRQTMLRGDQCTPGGNLLRMMHALQRSSKRAAIMTYAERKNLRVIITMAKSLMLPRFTPRVKKGLGLALVVSIVVLVIVIAYMLWRSRASLSSMALPAVIPAAPTGFLGPVVNAQFDESKWDLHIGYQSTSSPTITEASLKPKQGYYPKFACLGLQYYPEDKTWGTIFSATPSQTYPTSSVPIKTGCPGHIFYPSTVPAS